MKKNLTLKIIAVIASLFIWVQAMLLQHQSTDINLPVKLTNVPEQLTFTQPIAQAVRFHVEGRGIDILLLKLAHTYVEIDAKDLKTKNNIIPLNKYQVNLPKYISLTRLQPLGNNIIKFEADDLARKSVPIALQFTSKDVENRFGQLPLEQNISFVEITGPQNEIDNIEEIKTRSINMDMLTGSAFSIDLIKPDTNVNLAQQSIKLQPVKTELSTRTISMIPIRLNDKKYSIVPAWVSVQLQGAMSDLDKIVPDDIHATVSTEGATNNQLIDVQVTISKPVRLLAYTPQKVRIQAHD